MIRVVVLQFAEAKLAARWTVSGPMRGEWTNPQPQSRGQVHCLSRRGLACQGAPASSEDLDHGGRESWCGLQPWRFRLGCCPNVGWGNECWWLGEVVPLWTGVDQVRWPQWGLRVQVGPWRPGSPGTAPEGRS